MNDANGTAPEIRGGPLSPVCGTMRARPQSQTSVDNVPSCVPSSRDSANVCKIAGSKPYTMGIFRVHVPHPPKTQN